MLGFSPLASAPLADAGAVTVYQILGENVTTGSPSVDTSNITLYYLFLVSDINTGQPVLSELSVFDPLYGDSIITGVTVVSEMILNGSIRRVVSVTSNSYNTVTLSKTYNKVV